MFESSAVGVDVRPVVDRELDDRERAGREVLVQPLARLDVARGHEVCSEFVPHFSSGTPKARIAVKPTRVMGSPFRARDRAP